MHPAASSLLPGIYPVITKIKPRIGGNNNLGVGVDSLGREYVLKHGRPIGVAEFIGAAVCSELDVPHCRTAIVTAPQWDGSMQYLFGSVIEADLHKFDQTSIDEWREVVDQLHDPIMFTVMLAVDLCLGNDDRHANNWIVKSKNPDTGADCLKLLAMDFSNAWPAVHPPHHPMRHPSNNTWVITRHWAAIGVAFEAQAFRTTCARIAGLDLAWLQNVLDPLVNIWLTLHERDTLCQWWQSHWRRQVIDAIYSLEPDGEWL